MKMITILLLASRWDKYIQRQYNEINVITDARTITDGTAAQGGSSEVNWVVEDWASILWEKRIPWQKDSNLWNGTENRVHRGE